MAAHPILGLVATIAVADPATCDRAGIADLVSSALTVRAWLDSMEATIAQQAARLAADGSGDPAATVLAGGGRRSGREARAVVARGGICAAMPELHEALASGTVSAGHVDAVARAAADLGDAGRADLVALGESLVDAAGSSSVETFERHVRDLGRRLSPDDGVRQDDKMRRQRSLRRWFDHHTGLTHTHVALDPEADARFSSALDAAVAAEQAKPDPEDRTWEQLRADAFVNLATGARTSGRRPAEILLLIDLDTMTTGLHETSVCATGDSQPVPPDVVRRHACDADIIPVVLNGRGVVLDVGTSSRVATAHQRRALRAMYRTCGHPGCTVRFDDCQIHHVIEWRHQQGPTNLANLLPLCSDHHHLVHEGGWHLTLSPDRTITLTRPDGTVYFHGSSVDVAPAGTTDPQAQPETVRSELAVALEAAVAAAVARTHRSSA